MPGNYVVSERFEPEKVLKYRYGAIGSPGSDFTTRVLAPGVQRTRSYRTVPSRGSEDEITAEDLKVTRNGFTTFDPVFDKGHEFSTYKETYPDPGLTNEVYLRARVSGSDVFYRGPIFLKMETQGLVSPPKRYFVPIDATPASSVSLSGQQAIMNCSPTSPNAQLSTAFLELFAGLPQMLGASIWKEQAQLARGAGGEYLNVQFGWKPMLSDIRKSVKALQNASRILAQAQRDSGRVVRRKFAFPATVSSSESSFTAYNGPWAGIGSNWAPSGAVVPTRVLERTSVETKFSGAFSYYIPVGDDLLSRMQRWDAQANLLLGSRVTPETLWQLAPWSWLLDWKLGIGNAIGAANRLSEDNLVIRYGYLMVHTISERTFFHPGGITPAYGDRIPPVTQTLRSERKERFRATPYGFGISTDSLSDGQWSILTALGMTRAPKILF